MNRLLRLLLLCAAMLLTAPTVSAQLQQRRSPRQMVRGGMLQQRDTTRTGRAEGLDSLLTDQVLDSLRAVAGSDSVRLDSLLTAWHRDGDALARRYGVDSLHRARIDSLLTEETDSLIAAGVLDSLERSDSLFWSRMTEPEEAVDSAKLRRRGQFFSDSMSLSRVCWTAAVLPGYGQIYNKQYWKLPILYSTLGAGITMFVHENNKYQPLKKEFDAITSIDRSRTPELDALQTKMIRHNTRRQLYLIASVASYVYFIGDAAVKYSTNDVSDIKKATTLATICPGAGQIYNRSYWRVPFVIGGFAGMIYCVDWNNRGYQRFKKAYSLRASYDKALAAYNSDPENNPRPESSTDEFKGRYAASFLKNLRDNYRRNRDLCIILTAGLYVLQIIDAHVDAHLKDYDVSDDLSMSIEPMLDYTYVPAAGGNRPLYGFNLNFKF